MSIGHSFLKRLSSIDPDKTITNYQTKQESVQRLKTFEQAIKSMNDANEVIISTRLEMQRFDVEVDKYRGEMLERIENAERKIVTMQTHVDDIIKEARPGSYVHWNNPTSPDVLDDHVFETPPTMQEGEQ